MDDKQSSQNATYGEKVLKRTKEMSRIKAGKASETPGNPEYETIIIEETHIGGNPLITKKGIAIAGNAKRDDKGTDRNDTQLTQDGIAVKYRPKRCKNATVIRYTGSL